MTSVCVCVITCALVHLFPELISERLRHTHSLTVAGLASGLDLQSLSVLPAELSFTAALFVLCSRIARTPEKRSGRLTGISGVLWGKRLCSLVIVFALWHAAGDESVKPRTEHFLLETLENLCEGTMLYIHTLICEQDGFMSFTH